MRKSYPLLILLSLVIILAGCTKGSGTVKKGSELNTSTKMSMVYDKFNGHKETQIKVKDKEPVTIKVGIVTESGSIDAYIAKDNDVNNCSYKGNNIPTSSFTVTLSEQGTYTIRVDAKNHRGSYSFSWAK